MYCRLLDDLDSQARNAPDRVGWARAACKIAVHRARQGQLDEAQALILRIRETFGVELHHEIAPWVMLAEGVIHYFHLDMKMSWERLRRAYALAVALRLESARSTCAAWMSTIAYERSDYEDMAKFLVETFEQSNSESHHARGRASAVLAAAIHLAGDYELARTWYDRARIHAAAEGDQALISAMLFNVAVCRVTDLLLTDTYGSASEKELLRATMEIDSSRTYDAAVGVLSFKELTTLVRGHLRLIAKDFTAANELLESIEQSRLPPRELPIWLASHAWCLAGRGEIGVAQQKAASAETALTRVNDCDDLAYVYGRIAQVTKLAGRLQEAERLEGLGLKSLARHREDQLSALKRLQGVVDMVAMHLPKKKGPA